MNIILVRHGEISSNIKRIYAGRSSEQLTDRGVQQAKEVCENIKKFEVHALYSSPVQRALQTAQIIGNGIGKNLQTDDAFRELEMGPWEGLSDIDVAQEFPEEWNIWNSRPAELRLSGRETLDELLNRVLAGIQRILQGAERKTIVVISHVAIIRVLLLWHSRRSLNLYKTILVPNAGFFQIEIESILQ